MTFGVLLSNTVRYVARRSLAEISVVARVRLGEALDLFGGEYFVELRDQLVVDLVEFLALIRRHTQRVAGRRWRAPQSALAVRPQPVAPGGSRLKGLENFQTVSFSGVTSKTTPTAPALINVFPFGRRWAPEMNHE